MKRFFWPFVILCNILWSCSTLDNRLDATIQHVLVMEIPFEIDTIGTPDSIFIEADTSAAYFYSEDFNDYRDYIVSAKLDTIGLVVEGLSQEEIHFHELELVLQTPTYEVIWEFNDSYWFDDYYVNLAGDEEMENMLDLMINDTTDFTFLVRGTIEKNDDLVYSGSVVDFTARLSMKTELKAKY